MRGTLYFFTSLKSGNVAWILQDQGLTVKRGTHQTSAPRLFPHNYAEAMTDTVAELEQEGYTIKYCDMIFPDKEEA